MRDRNNGRGILALFLVLGIPILQPAGLCAQEAHRQGATHDSANEQRVNAAALGALIRQLQSQIQDLDTQVKDLKAQQRTTQTESAELRREFDITRSQLEALKAQPSGMMSAAAAPATQTEQPSMEERLTHLEESVQLTDSKVSEQSQTKVESGSKYRLRLNGILLLNLYGNVGSVENQDYPQIATAPGLLPSGGAFGGSLRQSQIGIQAFGPTIAGARTSAEIQFDFAGGFPTVPNGVSFGIMRLRTGTVRFDWQDTSVVGGQDTLFFLPLNPTSLATLAVPPLSYSGNLWSWTPQLRVEHRFHLSETSSLSLSGGILDSLSGEIPPVEYNRYPTWGERSGQPAYAGRIGWTHPFFGQDLTAGLGGYYGRQAWGFGRSVNGWAGTADLTLPLGPRIQLTGEFYRGRALGGLGGGIGQSVLWNGSLINPTTELYGVNSLGGWGQLKFKLTPMFQLNGAFGQDNPYASDLREFAGNPVYYKQPLSKSQTAFVNFIYQPRSDILFSLEYRRIKTFTLDSNANAANNINLSVGYTF